ncbi:MAG: YHYH protein, partial [Bacteroidota bacterium]
MNRILFVSFTLLLEVFSGKAQTNPVITTWLQNTTVKGRHYAAGNPIPINDAALANVQMVRYSTGSVYVNTNGIPAYITGPFLDGNPSIATPQNAIFRFPLNPVPNTGTPTATTPGNIGLFINGVALFDYRDGVSWRSSTNSLAGGPLGGNGDGVWNRDAVVAERVGFDCAKAHPAMGNYHHHQNPSAFNLDLAVISGICSTYPADGLYVIDSTRHSPLIGFAYDGYPIYGAYGYKNTDGTGGIVRMKSSYSLRNITTRNTYANGTPVAPGPPVNSTYPLGYFREDYQYIQPSTANPDYLDEHNGRFCKTPEFPNGTYCYFTTVNANWNSAYPYAVGPTFYGVKTAARVNSVTEPVTTFLPPSISVSASANGICSGTLVSFTASTVNGGTNPAFQWIKNGMNTGSNSPVFTDNTLSEGDVIRCKVTTSTGAVATSNSVTMSVTASVTPAIFISTATTTICAGAGTDFHAVYTNGGSSPAFQWQLNGQTVGNGTNWMSSQLQSGDVVSCTLSSNATCTTQPTANSNIISMTVMPVITPAVSISASRTSVCAGEEVVVTASPENGGNNPGIGWLVNGIQAGSGPALTLPDPADGTTISCILTSNAACATQSTALSGELQITVTPLVTPAVSISASRTSVCAGEEVVV